MYVCARVPVGCRDGFTLLQYLPTTVLCRCSMSSTRFQRRHRHRQTKSPLLPWEPTTTVGQPGVRLSAKIPQLEGGLAMILECSFVDSGDSTRQSGRFQKTAALFEPRLEPSFEPAPSPAARPGQLVVRRVQPLSAPTLSASTLRPSPLVVLPVGSASRGLCLRHQGDFATLPRAPW